MIALVLENTHEKELSYMEKCSRDIILKNSDDRWDYFLFREESELKNFLSEKKQGDIFCVDITTENGIPVAEEVRKSFPDSFLVLVANTKLSPMQYIKPAICAQSLLVRPYNTAMMKDTLSETIRCYLKKFQAEDGSQRFVLDTGEGRQLLSYDNIYFFEAREKKIFVNLDNDEYSFYSTLEDVSGKLPDMFLRCHRSFIVNKSKISNVKISQSLITLDNGMLLPLSRSYKSVFKEID